MEEWALYLAKWVGGVLDFLQAERVGGWVGGWVVRTYPVHDVALLEEELA